MKLYLAEPNELHIFELPSKVEGSFLFDFKIKNSTINNLLTIDSKEGKWLLKSNGNVNIQSGESTYKEYLLEEFSIIPLKAIGCDELIFLYVFPLANDSAICLNTDKRFPITLGSAKESNINLNNNLTLPTQLNLTFQNYIWYVVPNPNAHAYVYLNNKKLQAPKPLQCGDIIFSAGIKIIWMQEFIKITTSQNSLKINGLTSYSPPQIDNSNYSEVTEEEASIELYTDENYFFHTPRLRTVLEEETIKIDAPPENQEDTNDLPFLLSIGTSLTLVASSLMMGYNVIYNLSTGTRTIAAVIPSIVICIAMIVGSVIIPRLIRRYQKKMRHERELLRQKKYGEYIKEKENQIQLILKKQSQILNENNSALEECQTIITNLNRKIWNHEIEDDDFLTVRLGIGQAFAKLEIQVPEEHFTLDDDALRDQIYQIPEKYKRLDQVPVTVSLLENPLTAFICNCNFTDDFINGIILQLITYHSALDLKIILLTSEDKKERWSYFKMLPHCFSEDKSVRFFATNNSEIKNITSYLEKEYKKRQEIVESNGRESEIEEFDSNKEYKNFQPYYLIITDNYNDIKDLEFIRTYLSRTNNVGFSLMMIEKSLKNLPNECNMFVQVLEGNSGLFNKELTSENQIPFQAEYNPLIDMYDMARRVANIPIQSKEQEKSLPTSLSFLDVYNVGKIEQLNILNRWKTNNPVNTLACPIGVHSNSEPFILDLHEKVAGPHGLIAGSTGSGKSELIITYILSMAINYHPDEVQFVLIDYKGGGLAGAFENRDNNICIPHLAGTITNLDTSEMNRSLVSIESELKRRQEKFNEAKETSGESTMDIYKYQKLYREGIIKEPISHLFIISDEFAELKAQQPEFMSQLISTARIGRSLGVHLILATQKPSGVVNDQIWSNTRFRICLKVQTKADSNEMLKRPEAASLKEVGRFYLQVGYDEYFDIGQAGWAGARYVPTERVIKKIDDSINFIDNTGNIIKSINDVKKKKETETDRGDQLTNIVKYLIDLGEKEHLAPKKLWLPSLSEHLYIGNLRQKYQYKSEPFHIAPLIGEYDAPKEQKQGPYLMDITQKGNTIIYGQAGSGKENLLTTMIFSIIIDHSPKEAQFYIVDFGSETLKVFDKAPHVGDIVLLDEGEKLKNLILMLKKELDTRKKMFSDYAGSYEEYIKQSDNKLPLIMVILNGYENMTETYPRLVEALMPLFRDCSKYGVAFIITASSASTIRPRISQNFENKICLQMPNDYDYRDLLGSPKGLAPAEKFGRGIVSLKGEAYEFQTAFIHIKEKINITIKETIKQLIEFYQEKAKKIPILPNIVKVEDVLYELQNINNIPIGIERNSLEVCTYDFTKQKINLISSMHIANHIYFFYALAKEFLKLPKTKVVIIDALEIFKQKYEGAYIIQKDFDLFIQNLQQAQNTLREPIVYIFIGISSLLNKLQKESKDILEEIFNKGSMNTNDILIITDDYEEIKKIQINNWYRANVDSSCGIWLGSDVGTQLALNIASLSVEDKKVVFPCIAYPVYKGNYLIIKYVVDGVGDTIEQ